LKKEKLLKVDLINTSDDPNVLNEGCGAEFVHKEQSIPDNFTDKKEIKCVSFDGDADR
tara:strand:+ start:268 stop:441 length:174 start_codon:yes stop_codon:yes gene_type:complete